MSSGDFACVGLKYLVAFCVYFSVCVYLMLLMLFGILCIILGLLTVLSSLLFSSIPQICVRFLFLAEVETDLYKFQSFIGY